MFVVVQMNGIGVKAVVDTRVTHGCLASNVVAISRLKIEARDNIVASLNGRDHWVEGIIIFVPLKMG